MDCTAFACVVALEAAVRRCEFGAKGSWAAQPRVRGGETKAHEIRHEDTEFSSLGGEASKLGQGTREQGSRASVALHVIVLCNRPGTCW